MRLSTLYMYKNSAETMTKRMSQSNDVYLRMSAGKTLLKASDDPAAATDAVKHRTRWRSWRCIATCVPARAGVPDNILNGVGNLLTTTLKEKKNGFLLAGGSSGAGEEIKGIRANLMDLANNRDASGNYIFGF